MVDCPECLKVDGWQDTTGMLHAAQNIRHEAATEEDLDLAELCAAMADLDDPTARQVLHEKNLWIMRKVWRMRAQWRAIA